MRIKLSAIPKSFVIHDDDDVFDSFHESKVKDWNQKLISYNDQSFNPGVTVENFGYSYATLLSDGSFVRIHSILSRNNWAFYPGSADKALYFFSGGRLPRPGDEYEVPQLSDGWINSFFERGGSINFSEISTPESPARRQLMSSESKVSLSFICFGVAVVAVVGVFAVLQWRRHQRKQAQVHHEPDDCTPQFSLVDDTKWRNQVTSWSAFHRGPRLLEYRII